MFDLSMSNGTIDAELMGSLYDRYMEEKLAAEEAGFDGLMLNSHHATPFCMGGGVMNLEAAVLAQITHKPKIVLLGNLVPTWDDPLALLEELSFIDLLSRGRLVSGFVRGTGRESVATNASPTYNWERFQEAHDLIVKAWTTPGPFRWEGDHYQHRYVNPWFRPYQQPHPPIWTAGLVSRATIAWSAQHRYPYIIVSSQVQFTEQVFKIYQEEARQAGYEAGPEHTGIMFHVHVDDSEEKAYEVGRKLIEGVGNIFVPGSTGRANPFVQNLPGLSTRKTAGLLPTIADPKVAESRGLDSLVVGKQLFEGDAYKPISVEEHTQRRLKVWDGVLAAKGAVVGTPESVVRQLRELFAVVRPGNVMFWHGDGDMSHEDAMRHLKYMGEYVLPAVREMSKDLELPGAFERDPATGADITADTQHSPV
jgi:alkanesulfonate monooxygenase SsuD/methylene tetrahydromethanopterin reductase-like flavin-dependent oxidoreductase (luciferase family)